MSLLYTDKARSLDQDFIVYDWKNWLDFTNLQINGEYNMVRTSTYKVAVPDILVLTGYHKIPQRDIKYSRENVYHRDGYVCQYCGKRFKRDELTLDHVIPRSLGGRGTWDNVVAACSPCNAKKADRTPEQAGMYLIHPPTEPRWCKYLTTLQFSLPPP